MGSSKKMEMHKLNNSIALICLVLATVIAQAQDNRDLNQIKSSATYMQMNTRPKWQLDTVYPFQLALFGIDSSEYQSSKVLPKLDKPIILSFWMTTCYPCRVELDAYTRNYARNAGYPFPVYWDMNREFTQIMPGGLNGLPQVFVLDKNGKIVYHKRKYSTGDELALFEIVKGLQ
jgi:cytochrome c biogenesis protein CcmG, thiol:disulfide interchange protein DsbE